MFINHICSPQSVDQSQTNIPINKRYHCITYCSRSWFHTFLWKPQSASLDFELYFHKFLCAFCLNRLLLFARENKTPYFIFSFGREIYEWIDRFVNSVDLNPSLQTRLCLFNAIKSSAKCWMRTYRRVNAIFGTHMSVDLPSDRFGEFE